MTEKGYKGKRTLGVIVARGGSKGIPGKNIKPLAGKPLIVYTIEAAAKSQYLSRCIVSTDSEAIAVVAKAAGCDVPFMRPVELALDTTPAIPVIQHAVGWLKEHEGAEFDAVMILQPTSPLRTAGDIDACITKMVDTDADSVMSMVELSDFSPKKLKKIEDDRIVPLLEEEGRQSAPRQAAAAVYKRNCAIYLTRVPFIIAGDLFGAISRPYIMPAERSIDINTPYDFALVELLLSRMESS